MSKAFHELTEREILALAIALEEEDGRIYGEFAERLRADYPATAAALDRMQKEESNHRHRLLEAYRARFGEHLPLMRRQDVKGFVDRKPLWMARVLTVAQVRREAEMMEFETRRFYEAVAQRTTDAGIRQLLGDLAQEERRHTALAEHFEKEQTASGARAEEEATQRRMFVLQIVQPAPGRADGRIGVDARAAVRRGVRHAQQLGRVSRGHGGVGGRGHQHGFRRGALGRRRAERPRPSLAARRRVRAHDDARRHRPHAALL